MRRILPILLLALVAACSKDKDPDRPAKLVAFPESLKIQKVWTEKVGGTKVPLRLGLALEVEGDTVYAAGEKGDIAAFSLQSGHKQWETHTKLPLGGAVGFGDGKIVVGSTDGDVIALDARSGQRLWSTNVAAEILAAPAVSPKLALVRGVNGKLHALAMADGHELWQQQQSVPKLSLRGTASPAIAGDIAVTGFDNGRVVASSLSDGASVWETQLQIPAGKTDIDRLADVDTRAQIVGNDIYVVGFQGKVAMMALDSGQIWWSHDTSSYRGVALDDDTVYFSTAAGEVVALKRRTGIEVWRQKGLAHRGLSGPAVAGEAIVVADYQGYVHWLDRSTGAIIGRIRAGKVRYTNPPVYADGLLLLLNDRGVIDALRATPVAVHTAKPGAEGPLPVLPIVALVGRPNVGKSTLFNTLTRTRDAIVADVPGVTRDRQYGYGQFGTAAYVVIDTGGLVIENPSVIEAQMRIQTERAVAEADRLVLIVDARAGLTPQDEIIARELRRSGKPIILAVNKIESLDAQVALGDFHALGLGEPLPIAATHGQGIRELMSVVLAGFEESVREDSIDDAIRIAVIGRPNVGKSTLINRLLGEERVIASDEPGTTRDSILVPFRRDDRDFVLIDTAGIRRRSKVEDLIEKVSVAKTLQAMDYAHVVVMVLDAHDAVGEQDASVLGMALQRGRALLIAINKWDGIALEQRDEIRRQLALKLDFVPYAPLHFISARHGTGVGELAQSAVRAFEAAMREMPTRMLNRTLEAALQAHQPPLVNGRRIKLRYVHQGGRNPPRVIVHGNQGERVPDAYARYLANVFRKTFDLYACPVVVEFRTDANPYSERRTEHKVGHRPRRKGTASTGHRGAALAKIAGMKAARQRKVEAAAGHASRPVRAGVRPAAKQTAAYRAPKKSNAPARGGRGRGTKRK